MQALKDAGIVLIALTLLLSVRVQKADPAAPLDPGPLMTQTEAAAPADAPTPVRPAPESTALELPAADPAGPRVLWLDETRPAEVRESCGEIHIRVHERQTSEVHETVLAAPCPSA